MNELNQKNRQTYNRFANLYEKATTLLAPSYYGDNPEDLQLIDRILNQYINNDFNKRNDWVLELACGTGRLTVPLLQHGFNVIGIDISQEMIKELKTKVELLNQKEKNINDKLLIINSDIKNLSMTNFEHRPIKLIISTWSFLHSFSKEEQQSILEKLFSILQVNGYLIDFDGYQIFWSQDQIMSHDKDDKSFISSELGSLLVEKSKNLGGGNDFSYFLVDRFFLNTNMSPAIIQQRTIVHNGVEVFSENFMVQPPYDFVAKLCTAGFGRISVLNSQLSPFVFFSEMTKSASDIIYVCKKDSLV